MDASQAQGAGSRDGFVRLVEFKWLMAGVGWWVDLTRLQRDGDYGQECLQRALSSGSPQLRAHGAALLGAHGARAACH